VDGLVEERVPVGARTLVVVRPPDAEALLDEEAFARDELLPYWAELWPSGVALARHLAGLDLRGRRVLELGCGLALPSIAAALAGADVLATDWSEEALRFARRNATRNGADLEVALLRWSDGLARTPFDLVLAADVLYEARNVAPLLELLPRLAGEVLLSEPGRPHAASFLEQAAQSWEVAVAGERVYRLSAPVER
jgi:predicted nicotinamide N-methyase